jgi:leucyl aminopeptidase
MSNAPAITFSTLNKMPATGVLVALVGEDMAAQEKVQELLAKPQVERAVKSSDFKGKAGSALELLAPADSKLDKLIFMGLGDVSKMKENDWVKLGGVIGGKTGKDKSVTVWSAAPDMDDAGEVAANIAFGATLRSYNFDKYKTKKKDDKADKAKTKITIATDAAPAARKSWSQAEAVAGGVMLARDLVNEPANVLGPVEFGKAAKKLEKLGCKVTILGDKELKKIGMRTLLSVSQGSVKPAQVAVIDWKGGKAKDKPVAFVGKGVVFDTGGISIKPGAGMGDMKGDMGGAAAVTGVMHALAARKANVNAVGIIGCVENMPDGNATRPGDIVTSLSGQTIENLNTDAEGRLVLCDLLWYTEDKFKPKFMIDLATLTGAILVALGSEHAGLFSNDDELSEQLSGAGKATGELVWRMPLASAYDKLLDTPNADMKNIGGRWAGSITAAQFLQRFVRDCPWAHLDVAGTAMGSPKSEINQSWASGYGVRLLDRLVADNYEK